MEEYLVIFSYVPKYIYKTKKLTPEDKLIAERIIYLCKKEGFCWITNRSLSEIYNIKVETVSRHIKRLEKIGLIKCHYEKNNKNTRRIIYLVNNVWDNYNTNGKSYNQDSINQIVNHNNNNSIKKEYKDNTSLWFDKTYSKKEPTLAEKKEFEELLGEFCDE